MTIKIQVGIQRDPRFAPEHLSPPELEELSGLLREHEAAQGRLLFLEQRIQLFLLLARDRRGLVGPIEVDPRSGALTLPTAAPERAEERS